MTVDVTIDILFASRDSRNSRNSRNYENYENYEILRDRYEILRDRYEILRDRQNCQFHYTTADVTIGCVDILSPVHCDR